MLGVWFGSWAALAQDEVCAPYPLGRWQAELATAVESLEDPTTTRLFALVDELHTSARCVDAPVPPADLARFARLESVRWMYAQDPLSMAVWAGLAASIDPEGTWPVPSDHPIRRLAADPPVPAPTGPADRYVAHPKRGGVFLDGLWLPVPLAAPELPHLVQVFDDGGRRTGGWWQDGAAFRDESLSPTPTETQPPRWWADPEPGPDLSGFAAGRRDTAAAYRRYLEKEPTGEWAALARRRLDDLEWDAAAEVGTPQAARAYLEAWPMGRNRPAAEQVLEGEQFRRALEAGTAEALVLFRGRYPRGAFAAEAGRRLDEMAWVAARQQDTANAYARYRLAWPGGNHAREARLAQEELEWAETRAAGTEAAMRDWVARWPTGNHAREARAALDGARFWRLEVVVSDDGADPGAAAAVGDRLRQAIGELGFEVATAGTGPLEVGSGRLRVVLRAGTPPGAEAWLETPGLAPVAHATVRASGAGASAGQGLARALLDTLPPLSTWRRPRPEPEPPATGAAEPG